MKKFISLVLALTVMAVMFTGCGEQKTANKDEDKKVVESKDKEEGKKEDNKEEKIKLVFATNETPILTKEFWKIPSEKFMKENPNITIENIAQPSSNIMMRDFLKTQLATGEFPDVMVMGSPKDFVVADALLEFNESDLDYTNNPTVGKIDGKSYTVPYKKMVGGIWYNKNMFKEQGLTEPKTYEEFVNLCKKLEGKDITPISMGLKDGWPQLVFASCILSADLLTENPAWGLQRNKGETDFSSPEFKKSIEKYADLVRNYTNEDMASVSYAQMLELFFSQKAAMIPMGSWLIGEEQRVKPDFEVGFFPIPSDDNADSVAVWVNEGLAINKNTKHPEEAKQFVKFFMTDKEWYGEFLKTEMLFPTTKEDVPYEMSPLRKEIGNRIGNWNEVEHWYDMTGDAALLPGLQTYFNKMTQNIAMGADIDKELELFNQEWKMANDNLNQ
ncbi:MAG: extracellular solute-binding protein [Vallitalea sp.]|jgi:ABC-type glycerol-3-phosphate transport system substrate-binding protein|nr:extracellular solute-binding protein [Vallitalea sp.]